jgi:hypothetical protein
LRWKKVYAHFGDEKLVNVTHNAGAEVVGADKLVRRKYGRKDSPRLNNLRLEEKRLRGIKWSGNQTKTGSYQKIGNLRIQSDSP